MKKGYIHYDFLFFYKKTLEFRFFLFNFAIVSLNES